MMSKKLFFGRVQDKLSRLKLKGKIILSIVTVEFFIFSTSSSVGTFVTSQDVSELTSDLVLNAFHNNANKIRQMSGEMIQNARALAQTGQLLYQLKKKYPSIDVAQAGKAYVIDNFLDIPNAIGGGLWYEPYAIDPGKKYMGPYAYWENGKIQFTWDLNTPKYDYPNQDWYLVALPKNQDRSRPPKRQHYWTPPYYDEAGTQTLMITVDAFIYSDRNNSRIIGLSTVDWSLEAMQKFLSHFQYTEHSFAFLIDKASQSILYHPDKKLWIKKHTNLDFGKHLDFSAQKGKIQNLAKIPIDGQDYDLLYSNINDDFIFGLAVNRKEAYAMIPWMIARNVLILFITLFSIAIVLYFTINTLTRPLKELTDVVHRFSEKDFSARSDVHTADEIGELARTFNSMADSIEDYSKSMEEKVRERTRKLNESLDAITKLKFQQDGDYFLTSQLLKPLSGNYAKSDLVKIEYVVRQKKRFAFKKWKDEIGGDTCTTRSITLQGKNYTLFLNADAMGKSLQGASGILVLGTMFNSALERLSFSREIQAHSPERWLKNSFIELQKLFEAFDGRMFVSLIMGLIEDDTGALYFMNAEHPEMILYRNKQASFLESELYIRKIGMMGLSSKLQVNCFQLEKNDVLLLGSDGRDDILIGVHEEGHRHINEDERLILRHVEEADGSLDGILERIEATGELTDDLSLMRVQYIGTPAAVPKNNQEVKRMLQEANRHFQKGELQKAQDLLESILAIETEHVLALKNLIKILNKQGQYKIAAKYAEKYFEIKPSDTGFLQSISVVLLKAGKTKKAIEIAERLRLRRPTYKSNLKNLLLMHQNAGNHTRAAQIQKELTAIAKSLAEQQS